MVGTPLAATANTQDPRIFHLNHRQVSPMMNLIGANVQCCFLATSSPLSSRNGCSHLPPALGPAVPAPAVLLPAPLQSLIAVAPHASVPTAHTYPPRYFKKLHSRSELRDVMYYTDIKYYQGLYGVNISVKNIFKAGSGLLPPKRPPLWRRVHSAQLHIWRWGPPKGGSFAGC